MSPLTIYFGITVALGLLVSPSTGFCCGYDVTVGIIGVAVHGCCSYGPCNVFCCNCDGRGCYSECRSLNPDHNGETSEIVESVDVTLRVFQTIDYNGDNFIDFTEALVFYRNMTGSGSGAVNTGAAEAEFSGYFSHMDKNRNGLVERHEFDESLMP